MIEQAKFAYSRLGKVFEKQTKAIEEQGKKQFEALDVFKPEKKWKKKVKGLFPKIWELMKKKMKQIKIKNGKKILDKKP